MATVGTFHALWDLSLADTRVSDDGLAHLGGLVRLHALYLDGTKITGTGLRHLRPIAKLYQLSMRRTPVTNAGLREIRTLPVRNLSLDENPAHRRRAGGACGDSESKIPKH